MPAIDNEFDRLQLEELRRSRGWMLVTARIRKDLAKWTRELIAKNDEVTRGKIQAAELLLLLPEQLEQESLRAMEAAKK